MSNSEGERIHEPTLLRREQARRDGNIAKSQELATSLQSVGMLTAAYLTLGNVARWLRDWSRESWQATATDLSIDMPQFHSQMRQVVLGTLQATAPILLMFMLVAIASHWLQTGPVFTGKRIAADPSRLLGGGFAKRLFSLEGLLLTIISVPKTLLGVAAMCFSFWLHHLSFFELSQLPGELIPQRLLELVLYCSSHVALVLIATSTLDFGVKFWQHSQRLRMTEQELRDEARMQDGDDKVKVRRNTIRHIWRDNSRRTPNHSGW